MKNIKSYDSRHEEVEGVAHEAHAGVVDHDAADGEAAAGVRAQLCRTGMRYYKKR